MKIPNSNTTSHLVNITTVCFSRKVFLWLLLGMPALLAGRILTPAAAIGSQAAPLSDDRVQFPSTPPEPCAAAPGEERNVTVDDDPDTSPVEDRAFHGHYTTAVRGWIFSRGSWQGHPVFRVFYQDGGHAMAVKVADLLCRFYCYGQQRLGPAFLDPEQRPGGVGVAFRNRRSQAVNFYLDNTTPGGGKEVDGAMYILQASQPRHPLELIREVSHEFSHLTVPGIRGFADPHAPEDWANGYLGEALYMEWLSEDSGQTLIPAEQVGAWSRGRMHAVELAFLRLGPENLQLEPSMHYWEVEGMLYYLKRVYGMPFLDRMLTYGVSDFRIQTTADLNLSLSRATQEMPAVITIPGGLGGSAGEGTAPPTRADEDPCVLAPNQPIRTWIYLKEGHYRLRVKGGDKKWQLRGARILIGKEWPSLGVLSPDNSEVDFPASSTGWYGIQWRNMGAAPASILSWSWKLLEAGSQ